MHFKRVSSLVLFFFAAAKAAQHQVSVWLTTDGLQNPLTKKSQLAAREVRRYVHATTGQLPEIRQDNASFSSLLTWLKIGNIRKFSNTTNEAVVLTSLDNERVLSSLLEIAQVNGQRQDPADLLVVSSLLTSPEFHHASLTIAISPLVRVRCIIAAEPSEVKASVYAWISHALGVRFHLAGDTLPDPTVAKKAALYSSSVLFALPSSTATLESAPMFEHRGLQPFHDFGSGPDWWTEDFYKSVFEQMAKMQMNFLGLHTYVLPFQHSSFPVSKSPFLFFLVILTIVDRTQPPMSLQCG